MFLWEFSGSENDFPIQNGLDLSLPVFEVILAEITT